MTINEHLNHFRADDCGRVGKAVELAVASYLNKNTRERVREQGKIDVRACYRDTNGKTRYASVEVKTACAEIDNAERAPFVAYWPEPDVDVDIEHSVVVFTREQWAAFINGYNGRGKFVRVDAKRGKSHIQSFRGLYTGVRPSASLPIAEYIYSVVESMPTLAEWWDSMGR